MLIAANSLAGPSCQCSPPSAVANPTEAQVLLSPLAGHSPHADRRLGCRDVLGHDSRFHPSSSVRSCSSSENERIAASRHGDDEWVMQLPAEPASADGPRSRPVASTSPNAPLLDASGYSMMDRGWSALFGGKNGFDGRTRSPFEAGRGPRAERNWRNDLPRFSGYHTT